jgi:mRNA interferase MazF
MAPKRGEVWWVHFEPTKGSEVQKTRPAIIISNNISNKYLSRFQVIPVTSQIHVVYPGECLVKIKAQTCKAMIDLIRTVSNSRFGEKVTQLSSQDMGTVEQTILLQLGLID